MFFPLKYKTFTFQAIGERNTNSLEGITACKARPSIIANTETSLPALVWWSRSSQVPVKRNETTGKA
jgi:hypothetical protein